MYSFIQLSELGRRGENENARSLKQHQRGFEARLSRLRVWHSTAELRRFTYINNFILNVYTLCVPLMLPPTRSVMTVLRVTSFCWAVSCVAMAAKGLMSVQLQQNKSVPEKH